MSDIFEQNQSSREDFRQAYLREQQQLAQARAARTRRRAIFAFVLAGLILVLGVGSASTYNTLVRQREVVRSSWSQVENQMQRRADLIPNLVNTVKGITAQELEVYTRIADARSRLLRPEATPQERVQANAEIEQALPQLRVQILSLAEQYPQLRSNETFQRLMDELAGTENRIAVARRDYIQAVQDYNVTASRFPTMIFARLFGFRNLENYFTAAPSASQPPKVQF